MNPGAEERLVGIDIAQAHDHRLVEQRRFDRPAGATQARVKFRGGEFIFQWLGAEAGEKITQFILRDKQDAPKLARVAEDERAPIVEAEDNACPGVALLWRQEDQVARHAPVDDERSATVK